MVRSSTVSITPSQHAANHAIGGTDEIPSDTLNIQDPTLHASAHEEGGADVVKTVLKVASETGLTYTPEATEVFAFQLPVCVVQSVWVHITTLPDGSGVDTFGIGLTGAHNELMTVQDIDGFGAWTNIVPTQTVFESPTDIYTYFHAQFIDNTQGEWEVYVEYIVPVAV